MKIALLEKREDFKAVFISTLAWFIKVSPELNTDDIRPVCFRYNRLLNIVYPEGFSPTDLWSLVQDYRFNKSVVRRGIQRIYVWLAIKTPFERLFSPYFLKFHQLPKNMSRCAFLPGSHSIRIIDFEADICCVVAKPGAFSGFLESDVGGRKGISIAPKVLHYDSHLRFYTEKRISGISVDRVLNYNESMLAYAKVKGIMRDRYAESVEKMPFGMYLLHLQSELNDVVASLADRLGFEFSERILRMREMSERCALACQIEFVLVCDTHGDFQPGNILVANNDVWLIDWEYSARRSFFFDAIVLECDTRKIYDLAGRLERFYTKIRTEEGVLSWTGEDLSSDNEVYVILFLLEELILLLREASADYVIDPVKVVLPRVLELEIFLKKCKGDKAHD